MRRLVPFGIPVLLVGGLLGVLAACTQDNAAIERGGECFFANECAPGLVCVEQRGKGIRICTDDLTGVAGDPPGMGGDEDGGDGEGGSEDGAATDAPVVIPDTGVDQGVTDTGVVQDTGVDTGVPTDSGAD